MFPRAYFAQVMFAPAFFPIGGAIVLPPPATQPPNRMHLTIGLTL